MMIQLTNATAAVLSQWARLNGVSVKALVNRILTKAYGHFLDGQKAGLHDPEHLAQMPEIPDR